MEQSDILQYFERTLREDGEVSEPVAAIRTLIELIRTGEDETLSGLVDSLKTAIHTFTQSELCMVTAVTSGCELFLRFITLTALDHSDFNESKRIMVERGNVFLQKVASSRLKIGTLASPFITDGATILTHSRSRVVQQVLKEATRAKRRFTVYVTQSMPDGAGKKMYNDLTALGIPTILILDAAVGYIMEKVDMVLLGAEGVVESGGIINKIGTYSLAICAKEMNKPVYAVAESFKFARIFPLNQQDMPNTFKYPVSLLKDKSVDLSVQHPLVDYTPPSFITLLFTDLGVLTPSAVSDELIKLYL
ncbi:hypothetical protein CAPTEDRAFT_222112 [Capitella teleta]|uniref:Translation initiation factor eIF2B subunit alpha n=1 Tax=Capitella teleta TaxID=283909 RepID=R7V4Q9_CAPTE|nr:hypothetical protein CAPTEDRAFT_222112 [Capitella teleta]|eukprot:ELU13833.1 hypothetical protein CAPTEDRAFT_222112 [Capitella teleta]